MARRARRATLGLACTVVSSTVAADPEALAEAVDELDDLLRRLRRQHARLVDEKPYRAHELELTRATLDELAARLATLVATSATVGALGHALLLLEARLAKIDATGLPRRAT